MSIMKTYSYIGLFLMSILLIPFACGDNSTSDQTKEIHSKKVYQSLIAGQWYDASPEKLKQQISELFNKADVEPIKSVIGLILPHAGYAYSGLTACKGIKATEKSLYSRIIILGTSHRAPLENIISVPSVDFYETPLGQIPLDVDTIQELKKFPYFKEFPLAQRGEHSVEIELPLLQYLKKDFKLIPLICGRLDIETTEKVAQILQNYIDEKTLVIASSDFTHYGPNYNYVPFSENIPENLKKLDMGAYQYIEKRDVKGFYEYIKQTGITICGPYGIGVLMYLLPENTQAKLVEYKQSGEIVNDYQNSVSYFSIAFAGTWQKGEKKSMNVSTTLTPEEKKDLLKLARWTLEYVLEHNKLPSDNEIPIKITETMKTPRAAFVTLKIKDDLRGCIGEIFATKPMYKSVLQNAYNAGFKDPRFYPITKDELPKIKIDISLLTHPKKINHYNEIELGKHGIIMKKGYYQALFLPQVAPEQNWNLQQTLEHLAMKAGLPPDGYKEGAEFEVFEAEVFHEE
ncbi:MAG TPA: AmmeMemoRadiSam system protein B [Candidatus Hydrogenedens sp.]|nr:AmmeMemoRadiSam system protein B [Candidatus Hydrogenedens sp.]HOK08716.1 AmmeMemoRadiSam system protein B [Candidatus Hydrogenedens sp.]HOL18630.1 AmmeMemoRadiSam system protein B [Candidatus Hydrogenedens sp.]HPP57524.1 AmmeMemoRadiSam system protein B [Candidatus Hydrogenedens sp.]